MSPIEIEEVLLAHPQQLVSDVTVAGVRGSGRTSDELVPRAWVVLSQNGKSLGAARTKEELEKWHKTNLSKYKWLRGGIEIITEVSAHRRPMAALLTLPICRCRNLQQERLYVEFYRTNMNSD